MFDGMRAERSEACASDLRFDAWLAGELDEFAQAALVDHVADCARCRQRQARLLEARERFAASPAATPAWLSIERRGIVARRWAVRTTAVGVVLGAAAAALLWLRPSLEPAGARTKGGGDHVSFFVKRGEQVQRGTRRQRVQPGDKLRFAYTATAPRYLAIVSIDAAGKVSVYYPAAERAARIQPGVEVPLPSAVELDGVLGEERVFAMFCDTAIAIAPLRAELLDGAHGLRAPPGCTLDELLLTKEAAAP